MSILRFLRVINEELGTSSGGSRPQRTRPLALETLEGRAVLTLLGELPLPALPALNPTLPIIESLPPLVSGTTSGDASVPTAPADTGDVGPLPSDPSPEGTEPSGIPPVTPIDLPQDTSLPPVLSAQAESSSGWVSISGTVSDDESVEGLTVVCLTDAGFSIAMTVNADGSFQSDMFSVPPGTIMSMWTIDLDGLTSNTVVCIA